ncbi:hypothetical protein BN1232_03924 [Mycobacterium lentiflavum]|uniref:Uncharacterized protein n=1 Tax=Mycobacterium lentiflavum TaxID=141349 RepID=A0A0E3WD19_MYCLN|nr:hypothetical protein BN1232_03924 [Mycobacterium lentiflavum]
MMRGEPTHPQSEALWHKPKAISGSPAEPTIPQFVKA